MIRIRKSSDRGHANHGWLDTHYTFSFAQYHDPEHMGFRALRVMNDDVIAGGGGFPPHPHRDMEIISYVLDGKLEHKDSTGGGGVLVPGDVQTMTAGTGVVHSEYNPSSTEQMRLIQIWIEPRENGLEPAYAQAHFSRDSKRNAFRLIASPGGIDGSLSINRDVRLYAAILAEGEVARHELDEGRHGWVQVATGEVTLGGKRLNHGDGAAISGEQSLAVEAKAESEILLFDLD